MRKTLSNSSRPMQARCLALALTVAAFILTSGCGGKGDSFTPSQSNPAPGVTLQNIKIIPTSSIMLLAQTRQLFAYGTYSDGTTQDISSSVTWSVSPASNQFVSVNKSGIATATGLGATSVTATLGSVTGVLQLTVGTNSFSSSTLAILSVPYKNSEIDVGYFPQQTEINGGYAVQVVNLDADQFSSFLPVPVALISSIAMPAGYVPNAAAASQNSALVAVISYTSPNIQVIDASNNPLDVASNTLVATYHAPVSQSVTLNGTSCMICAAVVNPSNNQLILSTAQGFYSMNLSTGVFTQIPFTPAPSPSANITVDPVAVPDPFILSTVPNAGQIQILDLTTNSVTTYSNVGVAPTAGVIDLSTQFSAVVDGSTSDQTLIDFTANPPNPNTVPNVSACSGGPTYMNMTSLGVSASAIASNASHYLLTGQTGGSCLGFAIWPNGSGAGNQLNAANILYGYGPVPATPDGNAFVSGSDPNAIAMFTSVFDKKVYGILIDGNQQWLAKINSGVLAGAGNLSITAGAELPTGVDLSGDPMVLAAGVANDGIVFLPTPSTQLTLSSTSLNFGTVSVGTPSLQFTVTVANISQALLATQIALQGPNSGDFSLNTNCTGALQPLSNCGVNITFTPTAPVVVSSTSACPSSTSTCLSVAASGEPTQYVQLSGTGQ